MECPHCKKQMIQTDKTSKSISYKCPHCGTLMNRMRESWPKK